MRNRQLWIAVVCVALAGEAQGYLLDSLRDGLLRLHHHLTHRVKRQEDQGQDRRGYARLTFENCGDPGDPVYVREFYLDPNPILIPGSVDVGLTIDIKNNYTAPMPVSLEMMKKIPLLFGLSTWFRIPCLPNGVGSCTYDDLCETALFGANGCIEPDTRAEFDCGCPFSPGSYILKPATFEIPELPNTVPTYLLNGEFHVKAVANKDGQYIACYATTVDLRL